MDSKNFFIRTNFISDKTTLKIILLMSLYTVKSQDVIVEYTHGAIIKMRVERVVRGGSSDIIDKKGRTEWFMLYLVTDLRTYIIYLFLSVPKI